MAEDYRCPRYVLAYDAATLRAVLKRLQSHSVLGLDVEWRPCFGKGQPERSVALVQLSSPTLCVLVPTHHIASSQLPEELAAILASPSVLKCGAGIQDEDMVFTNPPRSRCWRPKRT